MLASSIGLKTGVTCRGNSFFEVPRFATCRPGRLSWWSGQLTRILGMMRGIDLIYLLPGLWMFALVTMT